MVFRFICQEMSTKLSTHEDCEERADCCLITHQVSAVAHKHRNGLQLLFVSDARLFKAPPPLTNAHLNRKLPFRYAAPADTGHFHKAKKTQHTHTQRRTKKHKFFKKDQKNKTSVIFMCSFCVRFSHHHLCARSWSWLMKELKWGCQRIGVALHLHLNYRTIS